MTSFEQAGLSKGRAMGELSRNIQTGLTTDRTGLQRIETVKVNLGSGRISAVNKRAAGTMTETSGLIGGMRG